MSETNDNKAVYGSEYNWDLQRRKQRVAARNRDERLHGEIINEDHD